MQLSELKQKKEQVLHFWHQNERYRPVAFFILGFLFDIVMLERIDSMVAIINQAVYLVLIGAFVFIQTLEVNQRLQLPQWLLQGRGAKIWHWRNEAVHFMLGSLLNLYTLFFFKSSSFTVSIFFLLVMAGLLFINEVESIKSQGLEIKVALFSMCLICFMACMCPILLGFIGLIPFLLAILLASFVLLSLISALLRYQVTQKNVVRSWIVPSGGVTVLILLLYLFHVLPPVPLSIQYMGIYHKIERTDGGYVGRHERSWWRFWHNGDQSFKAEPGDKIYCMANIFSPTAFKDKVYFHWMMKHPENGWQDMDRIPIEIMGGRNEGFRGFAYKSNFQEGQWRVLVETSDGREIGRLGFHVYMEPTNTERVFQEDKL